MLEDPYQCISCTSEKFALERQRGPRLPSAELPVPGLDLLSWELPSESLNDASFRMFKSRQSSIIGVPIGLDWDWLELGQLNSGLPHGAAVLSSVLSQVRLSTSPSEEGI